MLGKGNKSWYSQFRSPFLLFPLGQNLYPSYYEIQLLSEISYYWRINILQRVPTYAVICCGSPYTDRKLYPKGALSQCRLFQHLMLLEVFSAPAYLILHHLRSSSSFWSFCHRLWDLYVHVLCSFDPFLDATSSIISCGIPFPICLVLEELNSPHSVYIFCCELWNLQASVINWY